MKAPHQAFLDEALGNPKEWRRRLAYVRTELRRQNKDYDKAMKSLPVPSDWAESTLAARGKAPVRAWRSRDFLALEFDYPDGGIRLSILRTEIDHQGGWKDGITWDELMQVKTECGFGEVWPTEIYPPVSDVVNVANIRHLWIVPERPAYAWEGGVK